MHDEGACDLMPRDLREFPNVIVRRKVPFWPAKVVGVVESSARGLNPRRDEDSTLSDVDPLPSLSL